MKKNLRTFAGITLAAAMLVAPSAQLYAEETPPMDTDDQDILSALFSDFFATSRGDKRENEERRNEGDVKKNDARSRSASTTTVTTTSSTKTATSTPATTTPTSPIAPPAALPSTGGNGTPSTISLPITTTSPTKTATTTAGATIPVEPRGVNPLTYVKSGAFVGPGASIYTRRSLDPDIARMLALLGAVAAATGLVLIREHIRVPRQFGSFGMDRNAKLFSNNLD